jgi:hypothetical protein
MLGWMAKIFQICAFLLLTAAIPVYPQAADKAQPAAALENGVYHSNVTGIQFTLPSDWIVVSQERASSSVETVWLRDTVSNIVATVWLKARTADSSNIPAMLERRLDSKAIQRNNFEGYKYRPESVQHSTIGGQPALSAIADYVRTGQQRVEYLTWIDGEKSRVVFAARLPASELPGFQSRFEAVIESAVVP